MKESENARQIFKDLALTYSDIGSREIGILSIHIKHNLKKDNELNMKLSKIRKCDYDYNEDGSIKKFHLMVDGEYFKRREAISFNNGGFIGFAGWASSGNEKPFIDAFISWCHFIHENRLK